ncbi:hypothetical protein FGO68_gene12026 [Halteria grandinella]|uniref:Uncharacterized protein n=1 Tax=Halteria grandinella TaxID=5974 RepID=A0A8J8T395_HALGN|nr:hypothetical protein FGO68_gene12026 [Halteria grandinella]
MSSTFSFARTSAPINSLEFKTHLAFLRALKYTTDPKIIERDSRMCIQCWMIIFEPSGKKLDPNVAKKERPYYREKHQQHKMSNSFKGMLEATEEKIISFAKGNNRYKHEYDIIELFEVERTFYEQVMAQVQIPGSQEEEQKRVTRQQQNGVKRKVLKTAQRPPPDIAEPLETKRQKRDESTPQIIPAQIPPELQFLPIQVQVTNAKLEIPPSPTLTECSQNGKLLRQSEGSNSEVCSTVPSSNQQSPDDNNVAQIPNEEASDQERTDSIVEIVDIQPSIPLTSTTPQSINHQSQSQPIIRLQQPLNPEDPNSQPTAFFTSGQLHHFMQQTSQAISILSQRVLSLEQELRSLREFTDHASTLRAQQQQIQNPHIENNNPDVQEEEENEQPISPPQVQYEPNVEEEMKQGVGEDKSSDLNIRGEAQQEDLEEVIFISKSVSTSQQNCKNQDEESIEEEDQ